MTVEPLYRWLRSVFGHCARWGCFCSWHSARAHHELWGPCDEIKACNEQAFVCTFLRSERNGSCSICFLTYAHRSRWSIGHLRPLAIALCSGLLWPFQSCWSLVSALLQCLASNCSEDGLSSSSPVGSRSGLGVWCWMLAGFCRCASDRC